MSSLLEFDQVTATGQDRTYLNNFDLVINSGDCLGIVGIDESTRCIVEILGGKSRPFSGNLIVGGRRISSIPTVRRAQQLGIEIMYSPDQLFPNLTVQENILFGQTAVFISRTHERAVVGGLLSDLDLRLDRNAKLSTLSQEDRTLVGFAKTLISNPKVVIINQITSLTPMTLNTLRRVILQKMHENVSFLFLSSRFDDILSNIVTSIATISNGALSPISRMDDVRENPELIIPLLTGKQLQGPPSKEQESRLGAFHVFQSINELTASEYDMSYVFHFFGEQICAMFEASACRITRFDPNTLSIAENISYCEHNIPSSELITNAVYRVQFNGESAYIEDYADETIHGVCSDTSVINCRYIGVPIMLHLRVVGVIQLFFGSPHHISPNDLITLNNFARQAALVIDNTGLTAQSTLVKEAHHRIKNNLQSITTLLMLQKSPENSEEINHMLNATIMRVKAIAAVHELLSHNTSTSGMVNLKDLITVLLKNYETQVDALGIDFKTTLINYYLPFGKATTLVLILNEIVSNCIKHAFPTGCNNRQKTITIQLIENNYNLMAIISDNGVGLSRDHEQSILEKGSLGMKLITSLSQHDLGAEYEIRNNEDAGTTSTVYLFK